ncbi:MAG: DUF4126 family protein [Solirubrobacteraceae bacterium]
MHLVFDIFQGIGIAAAVGIRPFLPGLVVGVLASEDAQIDFAHSDFSFLQSVPFLLVMVLGTAALVFAERRLGRERLSAGPAALILAGVGVALGALFFAGALARGGYAFWPGLIGGVICALVGLAATQPLLRRVRDRLDAESAAALPLFTEAAAVIAAGLSVLLPPVGLIVLLLLLWLLIAGRGRGEQKYAGLRILR